MWTKSNSENQPLRCEGMTGLSRDQVAGLVSLVRDRIGGRFPVRGRRRLGLYRSVVAVLLHLRHNLSQTVVGELFGCSQPTVSRLVTLLRPIVIEVLVPVADQVQQRELRSTTRVDGFVVPTGDHRLTAYKQQMWSHKNHMVGQNVQVVSSRDGRLVLTGDCVPGATHDAEAWRTSGLADRFSGRLHADGGPGVIGDLAYIGTGVLTGYKRTNGRALSTSEREFNRSINSWRAAVERAIAHLCNWKILNTGYRGLLSRFPANLQLVTHLEIYRAWT